MGSSSEGSGLGPKSLHTFSPSDLTANNSTSLILAHFANKETGSERSSHLAQGHIIGAEPGFHQFCLTHSFGDSRLRLPGTKQTNDRKVFAFEPFPGACALIRKSLYLHLHGPNKLTRIYIDQDIVSFAISFLVPSYVIRGMILLSYEMECEKSVGLSSQLWGICMPPEVS